MQQLSRWQYWHHYRFCAFHTNGWLSCAASGAIQWGQLMESERIRQSKSPNVIDFHIKEMPAILLHLFHSKIIHYKMGQLAINKIYQS